MRHIFKDIGVVSLFTIGSRILGLLRDVLIFALLGAGIWNSAFIIAFTLPNLFRRLLGEGALTSAFVPVFSGIVEKEGRARGFLFFNQMLLRLGLTLAVVVVLGILTLAILAESSLLSERWRLGAELSLWLLPYMIFICLAAIISAGLQCLGRFKAAASTPVLLNLAMIAALVTAYFRDASAPESVYLLCGGVLLGGVLQLLLPGLAFARAGWRPRLTSARSEALSRMWGLFVPGLMGAAILQINILVSRLLAFSLDETSVSLLYLASRLMELPLGVFTIAVVTVYFPLLARQASSRDSAAFSLSYREGLSLILAITIPAGVGLAALGMPILKLLEWGAFAGDDVRATLPLLLIYGLGLPLYSVATFATRGLHAREDMVTPVRIAGLCLLTNAGLGLVFMQFYGAAGLALGNVLSATLQAILLVRATRKRTADTQKRTADTHGFAQMLPGLAKVLVASFIMGLLCWLGQRYVAPDWDALSKVSAGFLVGGLVPGGILFYFGLLWLFRYEGLELFRSTLLRRLRGG